MWNASNSKFLWWLLHRMACGYHVQSVPGSFSIVGTNFILLFVGKKAMEIEKKNKIIE